MLRDTSLGIGGFVQWKMAAVAAVEDLTNTAGVSGTAGGNAESSS